MALYHSARGSVNYTVVGNPTIVDGIAHLSDGNYLDFANFPFASANWEIGLKADTDYVQGQAQQRIVSRGNSFYFRVYGNSLRWQLYNGTDHYIGDENCTVKNYPFVRIVKTNSGVDFYLSADGKTYTKQAEGLGDGSQTDGTLHFGLSGGNGWKGTLDLNHTYIKVNGQAWFGVCPIEVKKHQLMGPVGYTVVGSPTITDGVASGFSDSNYLKLSDSFSEEGDIDIVVELTTDDLTAQQYPFSWNSKPASAVRNCGLYIIQDGKYGFVLRDTADNNYQNTAPSAYALSANTTYYLRLLFTAADKSLKMGSSTDGINYIYGINQTLQANMCPMNRNDISIGRAMPNNYYFLGSVDLNETYIKVNGKLWFWQPRETERIVVNGVEVWTKPQGE